MHNRTYFLASMAMKASFWKTLLVMCTWSLLGPAYVIDALDQLSSTLISTERLVSSTPVALKQFTRLIPHTNRSDITPVLLTACLIIERAIKSDIYDYDRSAAAIDLGVEYVNEYLLSPRFQLRTVYTDIGNVCSQKTHIVSHLMGLRARHIQCDVYIGPGCGATAEAMYNIIEYFDTPVIACPAADIGTMDSLISDYPYINRISITYTTITDVLVRFLEYKNYTTPVFLQDFSYEFFSKMNAVVTETIKVHYWELYYRSKFFQLASTDTSVTSVQIMQILRNADKTSRVLVLLADADTVRRIMILASALGMTTGDHVFISIELFASAVWGSYTWQRNDKDDPIAKEAFRVLLLLSLRKPLSEEVFNFWSKTVDLSKRKYNYSMPEHQIDPIVTHYFDAIVLYGTIVKELATSGTFKSARFVGKYTNNYTFYSPVNGDIFLSTDSDRLWYYVLSNLDKDSYKYEDYLGFPPKSHDVDVMGIHYFDDWPNGENALPPNTPFCGFLGENPECHLMTEDTDTEFQFLLTETVTPIAVLCLVTLAIVITMMRIRQQQNNSLASWRIYPREIDGLHEESTMMLHKNLVANSKSDSAMYDSKNLSIESRSETTPETLSLRGVSVHVRKLNIPHHRLSYAIHKDVAEVNSVQHNNLQKFVGLVVDLSNRCECVVGEWCSRGCLNDLIEDRKLDLDYEFKQSLTKDLANGLWFLHSTPIKSHGHLSAFTCLIDNRFSLKISHFGLPSLVSAYLLEPPTEGLSDDEYTTLLWRAPELLRSRMPPSGTPKGDIYSFGILWQQITLQSRPFQLPASLNRGRNNLVSAAKDIVLEVQLGRDPPTRPPIPRGSCSSELRTNMELSWQEDPMLRPTMSKLKAFVTETKGRAKMNDTLLDHLVARMEQYAIDLEKQVEDKTTQFMTEKERTTSILSNVLPRPIALTLMMGGTVRPETFDSVTVYFGHIPGFSDVVSHVATTPSEHMQILNSLSSTYDTFIENRNVYEIEYLNVNGSSLIVSGLPVRNGNKHAQEIALLALDLRKAIETFEVKGFTGSALMLRVGIHSGPCVAGVIGSKLPKYCVFGDTVNTASRMETTGKAGNIHCSAAAKSFLDGDSAFIFESREAVNVKGKGLMETFWLQSKSELPLIISKN